MEVSGNFSQILDPKTNFLAGFHRNRVNSDTFEALVQHPTEQSLLLRRPALLRSGIRCSDSARTRMGASTRVEWLVDGEEGPVAKAATDIYAMEAETDKLAKTLPDGLKEIAESGVRCS